MVNQAVFERLVQVARSRQTINYHDLASIADLTLDQAGDEIKTLGSILDEIAEADVAAGRPLLAAVVVRGDTNMPGSGLFKFARRRGLQKSDDITFFATELKRVHDYWSKAPT